MNRTSIAKILKKKVLLLDGSYGAEFIRRGFSGQMPPEVLNVDDPALVKAVHEDYVKAGADIILTNTFSATPHKFAQHGMKELEGNITRAVALAKEAASGHTLVFGDIGPTGELPYPLGDKMFAFYYDNFKATAKVLMDRGVDGIILETFSDILELKAAVLAVRDLSKEVFLVVHLTFNETGRSMTGTDPYNFAITFGDLDVDCLGMNCTLGPEQMLTIFQELSKHTSIFQSVEPNAGLPQLVDGKTAYPVGPKDFAIQLDSYWESGANIIGGCCGTTPEHIREMRKALGNRAPVQRKAEPVTAVTSPTRIVTFDDFVAIGERINPAGRKRLREAMEKGEMDLILKEAQDQAAAGAQVLDVNFGLESAVSQDFMEKLLQAIVYKVGTPVSIDVQTPEVLERLMRAYPGRPLVNSSKATAEDLDRRGGLLIRYGGVLMVLCMEDDVPKDLADRKKAIESALKYTKAMGIGKERLVFDPIVLSMGAGGRPQDTLDAVTYLHGKGLISSCGLSNLSFGLPDRPYINASFLTLAVRNGVSASIINPLDEVVWKTLKSALVVVGRQELPKAEVKAESAVVEMLLSGKEKELVEFIGSQLAAQEPMAVVEAHLKPAMERVGQMYSCGKVYLPQLILAAQTAKKGFEVVEAKLSGSVCGPVFVIATVKGDVHDIGKNIIAAVLRSSGYNVVDLGKDVAEEKYFEAVKEHRPLALGLSAMMTTTAPRIKEIMSALKKNGLAVPVVCGGASLNDNVVHDMGADHYAKDAVQALAVLKGLAKQTQH